MFLIGLTGGIAAGKSTVAALWETLGGVQIDADELARAVVEPNSLGLELVRERFGDKIISTDGSLNRNALGNIVFNNPAERKALEAILHPLVRKEAQKRLSQLPADSMVIYNVPLLVEASVDLDFDRVVTVEAPVEDQVKRMVSNRGMSEAEATARIRAQATPAQRANRADFILNSNQDLSGLYRDATKLWHEFEREAAAKNGTH
ncbi:MAG: dephospho-CoA kinase [Micrococcales bacterium]